eukprot:143922-Rhodomonas_salina.1
MLKEALGLVSEECFQHEQRRRPLAGQLGGARDEVGEGLGGAVKWGLVAMPVGQGLQVVMEE